MISNLLFPRLSEFIAVQMGLHFPEERWRDLERGIGSVAREFGFQEAENCAQWLLSSPLTRSQIQILASHLTVGETYFFREQKSFETLREHVLQPLIRSRRETEQRLRIWSAGCCTGEEPYSIAILLSQILSDWPDWQDWNISILATDINPRFLQKASEGIYGEWSFRGVPRSLQETYFNRTKEGRYELLPHIKKMVTFSYLNLADDVYPSLSNHTIAMDIIFCRNVLMYFAPERANAVIQNFHRSLVNDGWLIVSPSEFSYTLFAPFTTVTFPTDIFYRKRGDQADVATASLDKPSEEKTFWPTLESAPAAAPETEAPPFPGHDDLPPPTAEESEASTTAYEEALTLYQQGCYEKVSERLLASLSQDRNDAGAMVLLARAYANQGQLSEALRWCEKAILIDKLNQAAHYLQALIFQEHGAQQEAESSFKRTLYLDPDFVLAHFALGNSTLRQGKVKESLKHFENALSLLDTYKSADLLPGSEGVTAGRLAEMIRSIISSQSSICQLSV